MSRNHIFIAFLIGIIGISIVLNFINFLNLRSLWFDEAALGLNIVGKSYTDLFLPLDNDQVAPIGFLLAEKWFSLRFGNTDWSLRIFPLLAYLFSIIAMYYTSKKVIGNIFLTLFATAYFSSSYYIMAFSSEAKQYMSDLLISLIIIYSTLVLSQKPNSKKYGIFAVVGLLSIWFSNIAVILLLSVGIYILYISFDNKSQTIKGFLLVCIWAISFLIYYYFFIHDHPTRDMMINYWTRADAFLPKNIFSVAFYFSIIDKIKSLFGLLGYSYLSLITLPIFASGSYYLWKKNKTILFLFISPLLIHLTLSYFYLYPFEARLYLYLYPFLIIIIACGLHQILLLIPSKLVDFYKGILILTLFSNLVLIGIRGFPLEREEIKKSLYYMKDHIKSGDKLYVYYRSFYAFSFYRDKFTSKSELSETNITISDEHNADWNKYNDKLSEIKSPTWLIFSHYYQKRNEKGQIDVEYMIDFLDSNGFDVIVEERFTGSSVYKVVPN